MLKGTFEQYNAFDVFAIIGFSVILCLIKKLMGRVFANAPENLSSIPGRVIPKTKKMVLYASLLNTQHYKVGIKGKVEQSRERSSAPLHLGLVAIEKGAFWSPSTKVANITFL